MLKYPATEFHRFNTDQNTYPYFICVDPWQKTETSLAKKILSGITLH